MLRTWTPETEYIAAVVFYLKCSQAIARIFQGPMHCNRSSDELSMKRVWIGGMHVRVPASPLMPRRVWLRMNLRRDRLQHNHYPIALHDAPEVRSLAVFPALVSNFEAKLRPIEIQAGLQVVYNKEWRNAI